jgi:hypothetical protein
MARQITMRVSPTAKNKGGLWLPYEVVPTIKTRRTNKILDMISMEKATEIVRFRNSL